MLYVLYTVFVQYSKLEKRKRYLENLRKGKYIDDTVCTIFTGKIHV